MNSTTCMKHAKRLALGLAALALAATPSFAAEFDLCATTGTVTMPDGESVPIWGYADITGGDPCTLGLATLPGPELRAMAGDTLTINLSNALSVPVSIFIPGQPKILAPVGGNAPGTRVTSFDKTVANGVTAVSYTWTVKAGTYLYHSGTDITTQVPMGLYGALVVDAAVGQAYSGVAYDEDRVLVYSEIDPDLNADPTNFGGARVINWDPQYFLINGVAHDPAPGATNLPIGIQTNEDVLLRFVNAGLETFVPTFDGGLYMGLVAEDGNRYPQPLQQYGIELPAGKTIDAMVNVGTAGSYAIYDRALHLTNQAVLGGGMLTFLDVNAGVALFELSAATYAVAENGATLTVTVNRSGSSVGAVTVDYATVDGTATDGADYTAPLVPSTLSFADGVTTQTFDIAILDDLVFEGDETFSVDLSNAIGGALGTPASAVVTITDDEGPGTLQLAAASYSVAENVIGGILTVTVNRVGGSAGAVTVDYATADGTATDGADYTGAIVPVTLGFAEGVTTQTFDIAILDDLVYEGDEAFSVALSNATGGATIGTPASAGVTITENEPVANIAPTAVDDLAETSKNTSLVISKEVDLVVNDVDPDGDVVASTVTITSPGGVTQRGGWVVDNGDTLTYTPKSGFRGTDTFTYTVNDNDGETSNEATVRVNVTK